MKLLVLLSCLGTVTMCMCVDEQKRQVTTGPFWDALMNYFVCVCVFVKSRWLLNNTALPRRKGT